jgi:hypothetical protein
MSYSAIPSAQTESLFWSSGADAWLRPVLAEDNSGNFVSEVGDHHAYIDMFSAYSTACMYIRPAFYNKDGIDIDSV